jgi:hypothetical protein
MAQDNRSTADRLCRAAIGRRRVGWPAEKLEVCARFFGAQTNSNLERGLQEVVDGSEAAGDLAADIARGASRDARIVGCSPDRRHPDGRRSTQNVEHVPFRCAIHSATRPADRRAPPSAGIQHAIAAVTVSSAVVAASVAGS